MFAGSQLINTLPAIVAIAMAVSNGANDDAQSETETANVQKDVTIIGYAKAADASEREFATTVDPEGRDFTEREENDRTSHYVSHYDSDEGERKESYISEEAYEALFESGAFDPDNDDNVRLKKDVSHRVDYAHTPKKAVQAVIEGAFKAMTEEGEEIPEALEGYRLKDWGPSIQDRETWEDMVTFTAGTVSAQKVLVHQSEREEAIDKFEGDEERQAFSLTINMDADEADVEAFSETVVPAFMSYVSGLSGVGKVRVSDCKKRVEQEGDCFNAL